MITTYFGEEEYSTELQILDFNGGHIDESVFLEKIIRNNIILMPRDVRNKAKEKYKLEIVADQLAGKYKDYILFKNGIRPNPDYVDVDPTMYLQSLIDLLKERLLKDEYPREVIDILEGITYETVLEDFRNEKLEYLFNNLDLNKNMTFYERRENYLNIKNEKGKIQICETSQEDLQELSYELSDISEDAEIENPDFAKWLDLNNFKQDIGKNVFVSPDGEIVLSFSHNIVTAIKTPIGGQNVDIPQFIKHYDRNGYKNY